MSVFFLYPLFLFGLAAASLPILIHLLNRRRLKRIRFPAVRFILLSQKRISRSYRLRHWLLLALRTLAVIFLALLLANPIFQTGAGLFAAHRSHIRLRALRGSVNHRRIRLSRPGTPRHLPGTILLRRFRGRTGVVDCARGQRVDR